jgi:hypothetical protein
MAPKKTPVVQYVVVKDKDLNGNGIFNALGSLFSE